MKLAQFINDHLEEILIEWDSFAQTLRPAATEMSLLELRDHGKQILQQIARDIDRDQGDAQQSEKVKVNSPDEIDTDTAAASHGEERHDSGFTLLQLTAEYRALRASVLRLWMPRITTITEQTTNEMVRFNEAIDLALAESACTFSEKNAQVRDTFLAILGHDLRNPLATMSVAGDYLSRSEVGTDGTQQMGARVKRSTATMAKMVGDLLEYARTQLGGKLPITPHLADINEICQAALADAKAAHPTCTFQLESFGELLDDFDSPRLQQVFSNLLNNAAQYRSKNSPVTMIARGEPEAITVQVCNFGPVIPMQSREDIFNPLFQLYGEARPSTSVGLGLFIAREITVAHGGTITLESNASSGTTFSVRFPRTQTL